MTALQMLHLIVLANTCKQVGKGTYSVHHLPKDDYMLVFTTNRKDQVRHEISTAATPLKTERFEKMLLEQMTDADKFMVGMVQP